MMKTDGRKAEILLVDDDGDYLSLLSGHFKSQPSWRCTVANDATQALARMKQSRYDLVICDFMMPGLTGLDLVGKIRTVSPGLPVVLLTASEESSTVIEATRQGAYEFISKSEGMERIAQVVQEALDRSGAAPAGTGPRPARSGGIIGSSPAMREVLKEVGRVAARPVTVLIRGETGTGKEVVARALHQYSPAADRPFIAVNCAAIPETLLESELFGHEKGAFTGATQMKIGRFEQASGGTLFLDEIGDMTMNTQVKLLRVLQEKTIQRLGGGSQEISVDARVITATHQDLEDLIRKGKFREDLYYRLNVAVIRIPPLRERREEVPDFIAHFLEKAAAEFSVEPPRLTEEAVAFLSEKPWPGNVRQIQNVMTQAVLRFHSRTMGPADFEKILSAPTVSVAPVPGGDALENSIPSYIAGQLEEIIRKGESDALSRILAPVESELLGQCLKRAKGNQAQVARWLGISRPTLREKLLRYGHYENPKIDVISEEEGGKDVKP